jgi:hypothetical protein
MLGGCAMLGGLDLGDARGTQACVGDQSGVLSQGHLNADHEPHRDEDGKRRRKDARADAARAVATFAQTRARRGTGVKALD